MRTLSQLRSFSAVLTGLSDFLNHPIAFEQSRERILRRRGRRGESFLAMARRCVYENPRSPYLPLLRQAGCEYGDLEAGVRRLGLEALLRKLRDEGVWIGLEEFKGLRPIVRGRVERPAIAEDFNNARVRPLFQASTGGSTSSAVRTPIDLDFLAVRTEYDALCGRMLGVERRPLALWYPQLPSVAGIGSALRYARLGRPPERWFDLLTSARGRASWEGRLATGAIVHLSRLTRHPLPRPVPTGQGQIGRVLGWLLRRRDRFGGCVLQTYVSQAVRLSRRAREGGHSLAGVLFIADSEPLTPAKREEIRLSGARVYARYVCTELGTLGLMCGDSAEADDYHLAEDMVVLLQSEEGGVFQFTSLLPATPKVAINLELGDCGEVFRRPCRCLLGELGLHTHLRRVRSVSRVTSEGMAVPVAELIRIVEEVLCRRFGGSALDYQWVEREGEGGVNRLRLRVDPRVGPVDAKALAGAVLAELRRHGPSALAAASWGEAGTLEVVREPAQATGRGKVLPLLRERGA